MAQTEGNKVRVAMDGPDIEHDMLIANMDARNKEDGERASSAATSRNLIGQFLDQTSMNSQAYSWSRSILKKLDQANGQQKAMDVIMSLETALPMLKAHVGGQGTADLDLDTKAAKKSADVKTPEDDDTPETTDENIVGFGDDPK